MDGPGRPGLTGDLVAGRTVVVVRQWRHTNGHGRRFRQPVSNFLYNVELAGLEQRLAGQGERQEARTQQSSRPDPLH
jgi:hypothetical protein